MLFSMNRVVVVVDSRCWVLVTTTTVAMALRPHPGNCCYPLAVFPPPSFALIGPSTITITPRLLICGIREPTRHTAPGSSEVCQSFAPHAFYELIWNQSRWFDYVHYYSATDRKLIWIYVVYELLTNTHIINVYNFDNNNNKKIKLNTFTAFDLNKTCLKICDNKNISPIHFYFFNLIIYIKIFNYYLITFN